MCDYSNCQICKERNQEYSPIGSFYKKGNANKIMFIGQDPTIRKHQERVKTALMLDNKNSQIYRWLKEIFGEEILEESTILGTNLVKCILNKVPTDHEVGGVKYLNKPFINCKKYLVEELMSFKPNYVFTLGEPCYQLFYSLINNAEKYSALKLGNSFDGKLHNINFKGIEFKYSPLLHIQTYRVAKKYGKIVDIFERNIHKIL